MNMKHPLQRDYWHAIAESIWIWIRDPENGINNVSSAVRIVIWDAFKANGYEIPLPQREVHMITQPAG